MRRRLVATTALAGTLLASACALPPPRLDAERQWRDSISQLGMFAIYPASEDVSVGDAFLYVPDAPGFNLVRVTAAPRNLLAEQFCWQEEDRPALDTRPFPARAASGDQPAVAAHPGGQPGVHLCPQPTRGGSANTPNPRHGLRRVAPFDVRPEAGHLTRLREEAIPVLEVGRFSQGEIAGGLTSGNIGLALGFGGSAASAVRIELRQLQSASLEELRASRLIELVLLYRYRRVRETGGQDYANSLTPLMLARSLLYADHRNGSRMSRHFCQANFDALDTSGARVILANRVLYAGGVSYDFLSETVGAARLALDAASALSGRTQNPQVPELPDAVDGARPDRDQAARGNARLEAEIARLMGMVNNVLTLPAGGPGQARARLSVGRFGNLSLDRDFARPLAVGMGAALHFPIADAAVPVTEAQIEDVVQFCRLEHLIDARHEAALRARLKVNLGWVTYLAERSAGRTPAAVTPPASRGQLTPLLPSANVRVRI
jgi:hypothetical protein